jgi:DNA-binding transcriptional regulator GbsR (MarR family)
VSTSLRELQGWKLVRMVHVEADRRDHFETSTDVWELMRTIVRERQLREIDPTRLVLRDLLAAPEMKAEPAAVRQRLAQTLDLVDTLTAWSDEMLKLDSKTLAQLLKLGARIQKLLRGTGAAPSSDPPRSPLASGEESKPNPDF